MWQCLALARGAGLVGGRKWRARRARGHGAGAVPVVGVLRGAGTDLTRIVGRPLQEVALAAVRVLMAPLVQDQSARCETSGEIVVESVTGTDLSRKAIVVFRGRVAFAMKVRVVALTVMSLAVGPILRWERAVVLDAVAAGAVAGVEGPAVGASRSAALPLEGEEWTGMGGIGTQGTDRGGAMGLDFQMAVAPWARAVAVEVRLRRPREAEGPQVRWE